MADRRSCLHKAADLITDGELRALVLGDEDQVERLALLARAVEHEAEYSKNIDRGFGIVRRRHGGSYAELLRDPHVRAIRRARGLSVPSDEVRVGASA